MEKKRAESKSCCGRAFRDVSGRKVPIDPIFPEIPDEIELDAVSDWVLENV